MAPDLESDMRGFWIWPAVVVVGLVGSVASVKGDLPAVTVPTDPGEPRLRTSQPSNPQTDEQQRMLDLMEAQRARIMQMEGIQPPGAGQQPVDEIGFGLMMKSVTDPSVSLSNEWARQMQEMAAFGTFDRERQNGAVPELLVLLNSHRPLARGNFQIRHKALAALSRLAMISFGRLSVDDADEVEQAADADIVNLWHCWWDQVKDLDSEARKAATAKHRLTLIEHGLEDIGSEILVHNIEFSREAGDVSALPLLARMLEAPDAGKKNELMVVLRYYHQIYMSAKPGAEYVRPVLEFAKAVNSAELSHETQWVRQAGTMLNQMADLRMNMFANEQLTIQHNGKEVQVNAVVISEAGLAAVRAWLEKETKKD